MKILSKQLAAGANYGGAMEADTISKNGRSLKSRMSRGNVFKFMAVLLVVCFVYAGCNKDDDKPSSGSIDKITAKVENGSNYDGQITKVQLVAWNNSTNKYVMIAEGTWSNGGFTIDLAGKTLSNDYLYKFDDGDMPSTVKISNKDAKVCEDFRLVGVDEDGDDVTDFYYYKEDTNSEAGAGYFYVDSDVTITGTEKHSEEDWESTSTIKLNLKKGWNVTYYSGSCKESGSKEVCTSTWTTNSVGGLKWHAEEW